jgi:hypothetical protein
MKFVAQRDITGRTSLKPTGMQAEKDTASGRVTN